MASLAAALASLVAAACSDARAAASEAAAACSDPAALVAELAACAADAAASIALCAACDALTSDASSEPLAFPAETKASDALATEVVAAFCAAVS